MFPGDLDAQPDSPGGQWGHGGRRQRLWVLQVVACGPTQQRVKQGCRHEHGECWYIPGQGIYKKQND